MNRFFLHYLFRPTNIVIIIPSDKKMSSDIVHCSFMNADLLC